MGTRRTAWRWSLLPLLATLVLLPGRCLHLLLRCRWHPSPPMRPELGGSTCGRPLFIPEHRCSRRSGSKGGGCSPPVPSPVALRRRSRPLFRLRMAWCRRNGGQAMHHTGPMKDRRNAWSLRPAGGATGRGGHRALLCTVRPEVNSTRGGARRALANHKRKGRESEKSNHKQDGRKSGSEEKMIHG